MQNGYLYYFTPQMKNKLENKLTRLYESRQKLLSKLEKFTSEQLNHQPDNKEWSIAQVLHHLYLVERLSLNYMTEKSSEIDELSRTGFKERWRSFLLKLALKLPLKFKAPSTVKESIPDRVDIEKLKTDWETTYKEFKTFIAEFPTSAYHAKIFRHPRVGKINIFQTLSFIQDHFDHHLPQINRLLSKSKTA